eukprot:9361432-Heterocapsa_arctica.AAC.1
MGRPISTKYAKELREEMCGCEWGRPVSTEAISSIEETTRNTYSGARPGQPSDSWSNELSLPISDAQG